MFNQINRSRIFKYDRPSAAHLAGAYLFFSLCWISLSDYFVNGHGWLPAEVAVLQTIKGIVFVAAIASLVFLMSGSQPRGAASMLAQGTEISHELIASEARFHGVFQHALMSIVIADHNGNIVNCNAAFERLLGYSQDQLRGRHFTEYIHPEDRATDCDLARRLQSGELSSFQTESRYLHRDGGLIWVRKVVGNITATPQIHPQVFGFIIDITEERRVVNALRINEGRLRHVMDVTGEGSWDWSIETDTVSHNAQWCRLLKLDETYLQHHLTDFLELIHPDDRDIVSTTIATCLTGTETFCNEYRLRRSDGTYIWVQDRGKVVEHGPDGKASRMVGSFLDITEQRKMVDRQSQLLAELRTSTKAAQQQEALFRGVFEGSPYCLVLADLDRKIISYNSAFNLAFGYQTSELNGLSSKVLYANSADWEGITPHLKGSAPQYTSNQVSFLRKDGTTFPGRLTVTRVLDSAGNTIANLGIIRDISIEQRREQALKEKRHLESLGRLTGGIAHDFNNLLTIVSANMQLMELRLGDNDAQSRHCISEALTATAMGARLNQRLMTFARQRQLAPVAVNVNTLVTTMLDFVQRAIGESIEVQTDLAADPAVVMIDASELENAIINLALNSRDAMPAGGTLRLETYNIEIGSTDADATGEIKQGSYIGLRVTDTGIGMSEDVRSQAFDPFYTTKEPGKGTGIGLTTIHGFVRQSGGQVSISSTPGVGTSVTLLVPMMAKYTEQNEAQIRDAAMLHGRGEVVLLVEDNVSVRSATSALLTQLNYKVIQADKVSTALEIVRGGEHIDVVFSDIVMPGGLSGFDLALQLNNLRSALPAVLTSGFPDTAHRESGGTFEGRILLKPYTHQELANVIRSALDGTTGDFETTGSRQYQVVRDN